MSEPLIKIPETFSFCYILYRTPDPHQFILETEKLKAINCLAPFLQGWRWFLFLTGLIYNKCFGNTEQNTIQNSVNPQ